MRKMAVCQVITGRRRRTLIREMPEQAERNAERTLNGNGHNQALGPAVVTMRDFVIFQRIHNPWMIADPG
jgi:hypothetical protein